MPRQKKKQEEPQEVLTLALPIGRRGHQDARDPREPLPTGVVTEEGDPAPVLDKGERRTSEEISTRYARNLIANNGDIILALAATFRISVEQAAENMVALHERARGASRINTNMSDLMERHDLTLEVRLAKLREMMFHPTPAVALKAVDMATELDATAKSRRIGTTWETFLAGVRAGAGPKARAEREALLARRSSKAKTT